MLNVFKGICNDKRTVNIDILEKLLILAVEIAKEGREGKKVGTIFIFSDSKTTMELSRPLILDPLWKHPKSKKIIEDTNLRETIKELAQLDGAFIISEEGVFLSACRYVSAPLVDVDMPLGFGSRHMSAASITKQTNAIAIVVSMSSIVRVFENGILIGEILPEMWLFQKYSVHLSGDYSTQVLDNITVVSKENTAESNMDE
jgi:DNA integrity scanning protein DisA with diadenylate cyclase activity